MSQNRDVNPTVLHKWFSYPFALIATIAGAVLTIAFSAAALIGVVITRGSGRWADFIIYAWARTMGALFRIRLEVEGNHNLPSEGCLFLFNHNSMIDIIVFYLAIRKSARFGAKIELFKIPIFGAAMRQLQVLPIARGKIDKVMRVYERSIPRVVEKGNSYILAAEGTRNDLPGVGKRFKSGPFIFAVTGQFPIVPVVIIGADKVLPNKRLIGSWGRFWNPVKVKVLEPVPTKGKTLDDRHALKDQLRARMTTAYSEG